MAADAISRFWNYYMYENVDHRSDIWYIAASPWPVLILVPIYTYSVELIGPWLMRDRKPFNLKKIIILYNLVQMFICGWVFYKLYKLQWGWGVDTRWLCEPVDYSTSPRAMEMLYVHYVVLLVKIFDLLDTVFFVMRKKQNQVTFLHVYHHSGMVHSAWISLKYVPGGHLTFPVFVNSFVHVVMYFYYFITATWPKFRGNVWWKKYITQMQMVQFTMNFFHTFVTLFMTECDTVLFLRMTLLIQNPIFFSMFFNFYRHAYWKKKSN